MYSRATIHGQITRAAGFSSFVPSPGGEVAGQNSFRRRNSTPPYQGDNAKRSGPPVRVCYANYRNARDAARDAAFDFTNPQLFAVGQPPGFDNAQGGRVAATVVNECTALFDLTSRAGPPWACDKLPPAPRASGAF